MHVESISQIERFSHLFLTVENAYDNPKILKLPFDERRELLAYFGLSANPFVDAVDPCFYFKTPQHDIAYKKMRHCIEDNVSLGMLTAASGMGKTLIIQLLTNSLPKEKYAVVNIKVEQGLTKTAFLKNVLFALDFDKIFQGNATINDLMHLLTYKITTMHKRSHKRLILLLDEAQFLSLELWYLLKMISNIETPQVKLSTTLLFGEETLNKKLRQKNYASLSNRMYIKETIKPLTVFEVKQYLDFKLKQVNYEGELFSPEIYNVIFVATDGICREINNLVYNAMIEAFYMKKNQIDYDVLLKCLG